MRHLIKTDTFRETYLSQLQATLSDELRAAITDATKSLKCRRIFFDDSMGRVTLDISCRRGGHFTIATWDIYHSIHKNYYLPNLRRLPVVAHILEILSEYDEFRNDVCADQIVIAGDTK